MMSVAIRNIRSSFLKDLPLHFILTMDGQQTILNWNPYFSHYRKQETNKINWTEEKKRKSGDFQVANVQQYALASSWYRDINSWLVIHGRQYLTLLNGENKATSLWKGKWAERSQRRIKKASVLEFDWPMNWINAHPLDETSTGA